MLKSQCWFTWIVFIELNFTVLFLLIRKICRWGGSMGGFKKQGEWGILVIGKVGWYPFMDYEYPRSGSTWGKRQGLWKTINLEDESLHNRILRALSSSIYPTMVGGIFIFKVSGLLENAFVKFSLPTWHDMIISHLRAGQFPSKKVLPYFKRGTLWSQNMKRNNIGRKFRISFLIPFENHLIKNTSN